MRRPASASSRVDDAGEVPVVAVAGQRGGLGKLLEQLPKAGVGPEIAGLDDERIVEGSASSGLEGWHVEPVAGRHAARTLADANIGRVRSSMSSRAGLLGEVAVVEADDLGLGLLPRREGRGQRGRALGHEPGVGPIDEHGAAVWDPAISGSARRPRFCRRPWR